MLESVLYNLDICLEYVLGVAGTPIRLRSGGQKIKKYKCHVVYLDAHVPNRYR